MKIRTYAYRRKQAALNAYLEALPPPPSVEIDAGLADLCDNMLLVDEPAPGVLRVSDMKREGGSE